MQDVLIGRQPIFDARLEVQAYELFFRFGAQKTTTGALPPSATIEVLTSALTTFGLDRLVGGKPAAVNVTRELLLSDQPLPVAPDRLILEISCHLGADPDLLASIDRWKSRGFRVAIDDVLCDDAGLRGLFERADILKVDCLGRRLEDLSRDVSRLREHGKPLVAVKLETRRELDGCIELGFTQFQGYFLERPGVVRTRGIQPARATVLRLLFELQDPAGDLRRIEAVVCQDVGLSLRILRCVNSAAYGLARRVDSIAEAVMYLGLANVRNLAGLLLVAASSNEPRELLRMAMFRARLCEILSSTLRQRDQARCFMVGLLSLFDSLMGEPLPKLLEGLPVSTEVRNALLHHQGEAGRILHAVLDLERAQWESVLALGLSPEQVQTAWLAAVQWVDMIEQQLSTPAA
jgi:EAL and modified HD-GYP domain-containing signal transduction protein